MIGLFFFHDHHHGGEPCTHNHTEIAGGHAHHHHHESESHDEQHDHKNEEQDLNVQGIYLHILADALGSIGVIFSSILIKYYDMKVSDPICSAIISILILLSVVPLI